MPWLWFAPSETTAVYMGVLRRHLEQYGRPVALYSDRHSIFRINPVEPANGATTTQFGRALEGLEIEAIHTRTPQAKGRVERANQTLQDRLVKALRLRGIDDLASANAYLPAFMGALRVSTQLVTRAVSAAPEEPWPGGVQAEDGQFSRSATMSRVWTSMRPMDQSRIRYSAGYRRRGYHPTTHCDGIGNRVGNK